MTPRFFDLLNQHKVTTLQIHRADAEHATLRGLTTEPMPAGMPFDSELTRKLDTLIDAGSLFVANVGPAVRESMVLHGCKAYDPEQVRVHSGKRTRHSNLQNGVSERGTRKSDPRLSIAG